MQNVRQNFIVLALTIATVFFLGVESAKCAIIQANDIIRIAADQNVASGMFGGEYALYKKTGPGAEDWEFITKTFCLEREAPIDIGTSEYIQYVVAAVSGKIIYKDAPSEETLLDKTKFLYYAHQAGILDTFDLGGGVFFQYNDDNWAQSLQNAIWELQGDGVYLAKDEDKLIALADAEAANYTAQYDTNVFSLNLFELGQTPAGFDINDSSTWSTSDNHIQDLLWYSNPVPEPSTIAIWSLAGLGGLGLALRRRRKQK